MAKLDFSILDEYVDKETELDKNIKALEEKLKAMKESKERAEDERKGLESVLKKLPPVLAIGLKNIEEKQEEFSKLQTELTDLKKGWSFHFVVTKQNIKLQTELSDLKEGWVEEAKKSKISEDLIAKLIKIKGAPKTSNGGNKKVSPEEKLV
jgi:SMC interacting uncharacterized protein involved in chromosome segregation